MEQSTKEMKKRFKGLLTLVLVFLMMFGNSLTVLAQNYVVEYDNDGEPWPKTFEIAAGDTLELYSDYLGDFTLKMDGNEIPNPESIMSKSPIGVVYYKYSYNASQNYSVTVSKEITNWTTLTVTLVSLSQGNQNPQPGTGQENTHSHDFNWQTVIEPTLNSDGLSQLRCPCGAVEASQPISAATAYVSAICTDLKDAPQGAIVEINTKQYRCYTAKIMKSLRERPDVSLKTTFLDIDGTWKSFTIPEGCAPADEELFYGFTYLGNLYGWNEVPEA
ncbi:MAG: hypothetical protein J6J79_00920 [Lachnospiraceae bacterium]|nr:hypothetical protein [Lachnospiraceae bacterium]